MIAAPGTRACPVALRGTRASARSPASVVGSPRRTQAPLPRPTAITARPTDFRAELALPRLTRHELALLLTLAAVQFTHVVDFMRRCMPLGPQFMRSSRSGRTSSAACSFRHSRSPPPVADWSPRSGCVVSTTGGRVLPLRRVHRSTPARCAALRRVRAAPCRADRRRRVRRGDRRASSSRSSRISCRSRAGDRDGIVAALVLVPPSPACRRPVDRRAFDVAHALPRARRVEHRHRPSRRPLLRRRRRPPRARHASPSRRAAPPPSSA